MAMETDQLLAQYRHGGVAALLQLAGQENTVNSQLSAARAYLRQVIGSGQLPAGEVARLEAEIRSIEADMQARFYSIE